MEKNKIFILVLFLSLVIIIDFILFLKFGLLLRLLLGVDLILGGAFCAVIIFNAPTNLLQKIAYFIAICLFNMNIGVGLVIGLESKYIFLVFVLGIILFFTGNGMLVFNAIKNKTKNIE